MVVIGGRTQHEAGLETGFERLIGAKLCFLPRYAISSNIYGDSACWCDRRRDMARLSSDAALQQLA